MNGSEQAGECVRLLKRKRINIAQSTSGVEGRYLFLSMGHDYFVQERGTSGRLQIITTLVVYDFLIALRGLLRPKWHPRCATEFRWNSRRSRGQCKLNERCGCLGEHNGKDLVG